MKPIKRNGHREAPLANLSEKKLIFEPGVNDGIEPNRSVKDDLPHLLSLYKLEKFELRKKLQRMGVDEADLNSMTFNEMQTCYSNMMED